MVPWLLKSKGGMMITGVVIKPLKQIADERGKIMHMLREDDEIFEHFGEIYFSIVYPGVIKGWHLHRKMTLNYAVISGMIKLVLYDERKDSPTSKEIQEIFIGEDNYALVKIPPGVTNGFKGIGTKPAIVANCATLAHDPDEIVRIDPFKNQIPYNWELKHR
jgi:dTDP-4-dehydrorhamnose 3,5-epimerase